MNVKDAKLQNMATPKIRDQYNTNSISSFNCHTLTLYVKKIVNFLILDKFSKYQLNSSQVIELASKLVTFFPHHVFPNK